MSEYERISFTFQCPKCGVKWGFINKGATVNQHNQIVTIDELSEILGKADVTIDDNGDHYAIRPTRYLGDDWHPLHQRLKQVGGKWISNKTNKLNSHWTIPK